MINWLWLWLAGLQQKRAERRLAKLESFANTLIRTEDADLARDLGMLPAAPVVATELQKALAEAMCAQQKQYASALGGLLGNIAGGPAGGALGRQMAGGLLSQIPNRSLQ